MTFRLFILHKYLKYWILSSCFLGWKFYQWTLFCFSYASSSELIYIFVNKARFVFVLYPFTIILTELSIKFYIIIINYYYHHYYYFYHYHYHYMQWKFLDTWKKNYKIRREHVTYLLNRNFNLKVKKTVNVSFQARVASSIPGLIHAHAINTKPK